MCVCVCVCARVYVCVRVRACVCARVCLCTRLFHYALYEQKYSLIYFHATDLWASIYSVHIFVGLVFSIYCYCYYQYHCDRIIVVSNCWHRKVFPTA